MLKGRDREVRAAIVALNTPGQHVLLCGEPSSGRTSMATIVAAEKSKRSTVDYTVKWCDQEDTFESVLEAPLASVGVDVRRVEWSVQQTQTRKNELAVGDTVMGRERQFGEAVLYRPDGKMSAAEAAQYLRDTKGFLVIDGLETLRNPECLGKLGALAKRLSDARSSYKLIMTGSPETLSALSESYSPALTCLKVIQLPLLQTRDLVELVKAGASMSKRAFADEVVSEIAWLSAGFPHFAHLLSLRCVETAVTRGKNTIDMADLRYATVIAMQDMDDQLTTAFWNAVGYNPDRYAEAALKAAAAHDTTEFPCDYISSILHEIRPGVQCFKDERMKAYLRIRYPFD